MRALRPELLPRRVEGPQAPTVRVDVVMLFCCFAVNNIINKYEFNDLLNELDMIQNKGLLALSK